MVSFPMNLKSMLFVNLFQYILYLIVLSSLFYTPLLKIHEVYRIKSKQRALFSQLGLEFPEMFLIYNIKDYHFTVQPKNIQSGRYIQILLFIDMLKNYLKLDVFCLIKLISSWPIYFMKKFISWPIYFMKSQDYFITNKNNKHLCTSYYTHLCVSGQ